MTTPAAGLKIGRSCGPLFSKAGEKKGTEVPFFSLRYNADQYSQRASKEPVLALNPVLVSRS